MSIIGVIADDLTGAAELGGIGLRYGLPAEILLWGPGRWADSTGGPPDGGEARLLCLDTDSRFCSEKEAARRVVSAAMKLREWGAAWIYKKVDSVLRGQVAAEVSALASELHLKRTFLLPANPSLGRIIRDGRYFVHRQSLDQTEFARDPEYPRRTSDAAALLGPGNSAQVCRFDTSLPEAGIIIGEVASASDLEQWARLLDPSTLAAGGAEFFAASLAKSGLIRSASEVAPEPVMKAPQLFICGTTSESSRRFVQKERERGTPVFSLPDELARGHPLETGTITKLAENVLEVFASNSRVILQVGLRLVADRAIAAKLAMHLVEVAEPILRHSAVRHVFVEGGATGKELARRMEWSQLRVVQELAQGVVTLEPDGGRKALLTIKPGSYVWPGTVL